MNQIDKSESNNYYSDRMKKFSPYFFSELDQIIEKLKIEGKEIIRLDIGSPDLPPAPSVIEKLYQSSTNENTHGYQNHLGPLAYRQAWTTMYKKVFNVELDPKFSVIPLTGTKEGIFHLIQASINPGDIVLIPSPYYPTYLRGTQFSGGVPYFLPLKAENDYLPDYKSIPESIAQKAKLLWINYPNNPTGASAPFSVYKETVEFAKRYNLLICSDAAYSQVTYGEKPATSIFQVPGAEEVAVEFNSLSKSHNMAGWRIGVLVGSHPILKTFLSLKTNIDSGQFLPIMEAAIIALELDQDWIYERNQVYKDRRDFVLSYFKNIDIDIQMPEAAIYLWVPIPEKWNSLEFTSELLEKTAVSIAPGTIFGDEGEGFVRITLNKPIEQLKIAMDRIIQWWK